MKKSTSTLRDKPISRILIVVRRSNGDVLLSSPLIEYLHAYYASPRIDLLINDDTLAIAQRVQHVDTIHQYSYQWKKLGRWQRLKKIAKLFFSLFKKYDLSISLTATDSSVLYALFAGKHSVSVVEDVRKKNWWKKLLLGGAYTFNTDKHVVENNLKVLECMGFDSRDISQPQVGLFVPESANQAVSAKLSDLGVQQFVIFHATAQYEYKLYPEHLRNELLLGLNDLNVPIVVTGGRSDLDLKIKASLPTCGNVYDFIGETSLDEYIALSEMSLLYIGADTLNMHIAAAQRKPVFAWFGPTLTQVWSPWSLALGRCAEHNGGIQHYDKITLFQGRQSCVPCGKAGCDDKHGQSDCLHSINPSDILNEVRHHINTLKLG